MKRWHIIMLMVVCLILSSCMRGKVYDHYVDIHNEEWRQGDTITLHTDSIRNDGSYNSKVGIRIREEMPYIGVSILVTQKITNKDREGYTLTDTVDCQFVNDRGNKTGSGISHHQYIFPIRSQELHQGDTVTVTLCHIMNTDTIPAISEIGYILTKE